MRYVRGSRNPSETALLIESKAHPLLFSFDEKAVISRTSQWSVFVFMLSLSLSLRNCKKISPTISRLACEFPSVKFIKVGSAAATPWR
jgi:hypothetical protein